MKALVVDDDVLFSFNVERILKENFNLDVSICNSYNDFIENHELDGYDFYILDIYLDNHNVFEKISTQLANNKILVFVTAFPNQLSLNSIKVFPNSILLVKPFHEQSLICFINKFIPHKTDNDPTISLTGKNQLEFTLKIKEILYIEVFGNYSYAHTSDKRYILKLSLSKIIDISQGILVRVCKNIAVNLDYINLNPSKNGVLIIKEKEIKLSKNYLLT